jgi:two-component system response regulator YesN
LQLSERFTPKEIEKLIASVNDICDEILKSFEKSASSHLEGGKFVILLSFQNSRSDMFVYNSIVTLVDRVKVSIKRFLNVTACFSYSTMYNDITATERYFKEAEALLRQRFYKGKDSVIQERNKEPFVTEQLNLSLDDEKSVIMALKSLDGTKAVECVNSVFTKIKNGKYSYNSIQMICAELINIVNRVARDIGIDVGQIYEKSDVPYDQMKRLETVEEVRSWIIKIYQKLIIILRNARFSSNYSEYTKKAMSYILKNYAKNISLNDAAEHIGINSSYLSRIFKEDCGVGFVEYLNSTRVEFAKKAIEAGNEKLKDIAVNVGFNNYTYFTKVFKSILKMTPQEYEKKVNI